ncbi:MAG: hypothetical protein AAGA02_14995 [Bacteroidota bacterium]
MDRIKKIVRLIGFTIILIIASVGLGIAPALGQRKEEQLNRDVNIEMVDEREENEDELGLKE